jgi:hypothetical protein
MGFLRKMADRILEPLRNERGQVGTDPTQALKELLKGLEGANITFGDQQDPNKGKETRLGLPNIPSTGTSFFPGSFIGTVPTFGGLRTSQEGRRLENARLFGERQAATLQPILQQLMQQLGIGGSGGPFGGPSRSDLLDPRLQDIQEQQTRQERRVGQAAASGGRDVSGSVFQDALAQLAGGAQKERQRATGDVDTLLAQLGLGQQGLLQQLLLGILQQAGGFKLA